MATTTRSSPTPTRLRCRPAPEERDAQDLRGLPPRHADHPGRDDQRRPAGLHQLLTVGHRPHPTIPTPVSRFVHHRSPVSRRPVDERIPTPSSTGRAGVCRTGHSGRRPFRRSTTQEEAPVFSVTRDTIGNDRMSSTQRNAASLRRFMRTETGSAVVVVTAAAAALLWSNLDTPSYEHLWNTTLSIRIGGLGPSHSLRFWVNSGLMSLFFFVIGLEVRREFELGDLRERERAVTPILAGLGGVIAPVAVFLAFNAGRSGAQGWGVHRHGHCVCAGHARAPVRRCLRSPPVLHGDGVDR